MTYDVRKAKERLLPLQQSAKTENTSRTHFHQALAKILVKHHYAHITYSHFFPIQGRANKMASFNEDSGHSIGSGITRSKIVMLKVGDALRNSGRGVYVLS